MDGKVLSIFAALLVLTLSCYKLTEASTYFSCPPVTEDKDGTCTDKCYSDGDCQELTSCCQSVCGRTCTTPLSIPYHSPYLVCPEVTGTEVAGICSEECGDGCGNGELCCSNGCGHACMKGVNPSPLCRHMSERLGNSSLVGGYVPKCENDGSFSVAQCHASTGYCWCVATDTGVPISELTRFRMPQCNCTYGGQVHSVGETFLSLQEGSCDVCSCSVTGEIKCTYTPCQKGQQLKQEDVYYSCPAIRPSESPENCNTNCQSHSNCTFPLRCCYDGCGYSCIQPSRIPYIYPSSSAGGRCPAPSSVPCAKMTSSSVSCMDEGCSSGSICCENSCSGAMCLSTVDSTPCFSAVETALLSNSTLGSYKPLCTSQGLFRAIQCHEHFCWCVDTKSGRPLSDIVPFEQADNLECAACVYNGVEFKHLENFPSGDGCNTCTCIGGTISCSRVECVDYEDNADSSEMWGRWYSVLIACVIIVVVLVAVVLALLVGVMILMRQNSASHRHFRLKEEPNLLKHEHEMVEYRGGHESVELKVPMDDNLFTGST